MAKAVTINSIEKIMKENYKDKNTVEWNDITVEIKHTLDLAEMYAFVKDVVKGCFSEDGEYYPEMKSFAIKQHVLLSYTNVRLSEDISKRYKLIMCSGIMELVLSWIDMDQYNDMCSAIDKRIQIMVDTSISTAAREMAKAGAAMNEIADQLGGLFNEVNADDIKNMANAMSSGTIDAPAIMDAYMKAKAAENAAE